MSAWERQWNSANTDNWPIGCCHHFTWHHCTDLTVSNDVCANVSLWVENMAHGELVPWQLLVGFVLAVSSFSLAFSPHVVSTCENLYCLSPNNCNWISRQNWEGGIYYLSFYCSFSLSQTHTHSHTPYRSTINDRTNSFARPSRLFVLWSYSTDMQLQSLPTHLPTLAPPFWYSNNLYHRKIYSPISTYVNNTNCETNRRKWQRNLFLCISEFSRGEWISVCCGTV